MTEKEIHEAVMVKLSGRTLELYRANKELTTLRTQLQALAKEMREKVNGEDNERRLWPRSVIRGFADRLTRLSEAP